MYIVITLIEFDIFWKFDLRSWTNINSFIR